MPLDVFQQVFSLSLASGRVSGYHGTQTALQQALQLELASILPKIGGWTLAWGPVVWKHEPHNAETGPDNSWYIAFHPSLQFEDGSVHPTYVIAIAGTPDHSQYVWTQQNFAVDSVTDFTDWVARGIQNPPEQVPPKSIVPRSAYIATGAAHGVHILSSNPAPSGAVAAGTTLPDFVANVDTSNSPRFIFTGHSLGGALSPSLAFALVLNESIPGSNTLTYPTAGASPGNTGFADLFARTLPPRKSGSASGYQGWNLNLVNTLDVVPQAWALKSVSPEQNLGNIPRIYGLPVLPIVQGATLVFTTRALRSGVRYKPIPSQYFTGPPVPTAPTSLEEFLQILGPQHMGAYIREVGIPVPWSGRLVRRGITEKTEDEKRYDDPIIAQFEWARQHPKEARDAIKEAEGSAEAKAHLRENA